MTWDELIGKCRAQELAEKLELPSDFIANWAPTADDSKAAWELYTELRTRITVQPLHYMHGDEETALQSVADLFKTSRELIHKYGSPARHFATITVFLLNRVVRPFTARWHKKKCGGELNNEDTRHEFRGQLNRLQRDLRQFTTFLGALAEGTAFCEDSESWPLEVTPPARDKFPEPAAEVEASLDQPIPFDIAFDDGFDDLVDPNVAQERALARAQMRWHEHNAIRLRRDLDALPLPAIVPIDKPTPQHAIEQVVEQHQLPHQNSNDRLKDVAGLAISGGGIRSATFALGVVQRLETAPLP